MKLLGVALSLALVSTVLLFAPAGEGQTSGPVTERVLTISTASAKPTVPFWGFDGSSTKLFDVNGNGRLEIIAQNDNQWVYVFDSKSGALLAEVKTNFPAGWGARSINGPEVVVFESDGKTRLILVNSAAVVTSYLVDLSGSTPTKILLVKEWERRVNDCHTHAAVDAKPVLADLTKDGRYEILIATEEFGLFALRENGSILWKNCMEGGNAEPIVADLTQNGWLDVVYGDDGGIISALNGRTGQFLWRYHILNHYDLHSASMPVGGAVGQLDGKGGPDFVVGVRDSHDAVNYANNHAMLIALDSGGRLLWAKQDLDGGNPLTYTHPVIVDTNGDGKNEIYWADWNTMGHKPGNWEVTGPANFYRYDANGNMVWKTSLNTYWNNKDLVIGDMDGNGIQEVLANGPGPGGDGIWYLDTRTGAQKTFVSTHPWKVMRAPVIGDLWGTGTMQWVVQVHAADNSVTGGGILVYNTHAPYNAAWPGLPDATLDQPAPPPPPPGGSFDATFQITNPNEWWQQVDVKPNPARTVTKVEVRIGEGVWQPMVKNQWGAWTSSYHAKAGTKVEFLAWDAGSAASQSAPFTWLDGTTTKGSVTPGTAPSPSPPPSDEFKPTFTPASGVNEWWIDVKVSTPASLASVETSINGKPWVHLDKTSWGTWAKSLYAATGDKVQFRATTTTGQVAVSKDFFWLSDGPVSFAPKFEPRAQGNQWWVEVKVTGGTPVLVEARTDGGAWTTLPATSWGTWAKSYHVPPGSMIQFQATNDQGTKVQSASYKWG